jgi:hypothetical protein
MRLDPRNSPALFSALCAGLLFFVNALGFSWPLKHYQDRPLFFIYDDIRMDLHAHAWNHPGEDYPAAAVMRFYSPVLVRAAVILLLGGVLGRLFYRWRWENREPGPTCPAARDNYSLSWVLTRHQNRHGLSNTELAADLGCSLATLARVRSCVRPGAEPGRTAAQDVEHIASQFDIDRETLARILAEVGGHEGLLALVRRQRAARQADSRLHRPARNGDG